RAGIPMPEGSYNESPEVQKKKAKREKLLKLNQIALKTYRESMQRGALKALEYARSRRLNSEILETFQIGYAPAEWETLASKLIKLKAPMELASEVVLVRKRKDGRRYFDLFRDRLMFPIFSTRGEIIGFGGRALS